MDLSALVKKLGHQLVEIRERALKNILCKLDHNLVSFVDLVQEKSFFIYLLEWFNFPSVPMKEEVLHLLNRLTKHVSAAQLLLEIGAVDFFSQLRPNLEPNLQSLVDDILDSLFHLPSENSDDNSLASPKEFKAWPLQDFAVTSKQAESDNGYFQKEIQYSRIQAEDSVVHRNSVTCLKFSVFPWLTLTTTDRHVLSTNESSLKSSNYNLIWRSCQLLRDVVMQDFPAEIFLQRPKIVQSLLSLLGLASESDGQQHLAFQSVSCLYQLCMLLRHRLNFHRDPGFFCNKQEIVSRNSYGSYCQDTHRVSPTQNPSPDNENLRPSVLGHTSRLRGDGQDWDTASSSGNSTQVNATSRTAHLSPLDIGHLDLPEIEHENTLELQFQQLSLPQFCTALMEKAVPLLKSGRRKLIIFVLELFCEDLLLLSDAVSENVWEDESLMGQELRSKLLFVLGTLGEAILFHKNNSTEKSGSSLVNHRMAFISISLFTIRLLQTLLPVEKANDVLPESLTNALFLLSLDMPFHITYPGVHESVIAFLEQLNSEDYGIYKQTSETIYSIECVNTFMTYSNKEAEKDLLEVVELAANGLTSLSYHQHFPFMRKFIFLCSDIYKSAQSGSVLLEESQKVLLRMLSHQVSTVRAEAFNVCLDIVKDSLGVHNVTKPVSSVCHGVNFLLQSKVLYEISAFGLQDSNKEISCSAKSILTYLLQGHLVMKASTWSTFIEALNPVIPILQGFAGMEDTLGISIMTLCETSEKGEGILPKTTRLRAALRLLFSKKQGIRSVAVKWLAINLMNEEDANSKRPQLHGNILSNSDSLFIVERPTDIKLDDPGKSIFKVDTVSKVSGIFTSETVDLALRKSAAEQLVVIMQDITMHSVVKKNGLVEKIIHCLHEFVQQNGNVLDCVVFPCVTLLRKIVYADPVLRLSLAQDSSFLLMLFRVMLLQEDKSLLIESASLLCLLLFDEISKMDTWSKSTACSQPLFGLPVTVVRRFHIPFIVPAHHAVSPYTTVSSLSSEYLALKPVSDMLKLAWNLSWHQGIENILFQTSNQKQETESFSDTLKLSPDEVLSLKITHSASGLQDCMSSIIQAVSHEEVRYAISRIAFYLVNDRLVLNYLTEYKMSTLKCLPWHTALSRFLLVQPACVDDEKLLADVINLLNKILREQRGFSDFEDLRWILELLLKQSSSPLLDLIVQKEYPAKKDLDDAQAAVRQHLQKELMAFFNTLMLCLTSVTDRKCLVLSGSFRTQLAMHLVKSLKVTDAPHFYGLPSLGRTLRGLAHATSLPGWSSHCPTTEPYAVCVKSLTSLLEIISSFYVEWGGNAHSYMGKGVTKSTVLCLLHLSHEMIAQAKNTDWMHLWSLPYNHSNDEQVIPQLGLEWLIPLWVDRDPEVRFTSLGIGSALTSVQEGCIVLSDSCQNISGGLWGTVLNIFLDQSECNMVRREASFILQNLLVNPMPENLEDSKEYIFQGPCLHDDEAGLSLVGKIALQALLNHYYFYEHLNQMVKNCYLGRYTFDLNFSTESTKTVERNITSSEDSLYFWQSAPNISKPSSFSVSTLSTTIFPESSSSSADHLLPVSIPSVSENVANHLLDQGQTINTRASSLSSADLSAHLPDQCSLVTPVLLSATCSLLENLLVVNPADTVTSLREGHILKGLTSAVKPNLLERCLSDLKNTLTPQDCEESIKSQVVYLLQYISSLSRLTHVCLLVDIKIVKQDELLKPLLAILFSVLSMEYRQCFGIEILSEKYQSWMDIFIFLTTLLRKNGPDAHFHVTEYLTKCGNTMLDTVTECLSQATSQPALYIACMHFLSILFAEEGKQLQKQNTSQQTSLLSFLDGKLSIGNKLCKLILQSYEEKNSEDPLKQACTNTLTLLLAVSRSAQKQSLQAHLVDNCIEEMKHIYAQLNLDSLRPVKQEKKKKEEGHLKHLKVTLHLLRNCLYQNVECKEAALESKIVPVLHSLWPWLLMDDTLMQGALQLLCVYTANFPPACSSLCGTTPGSITMQLYQKAPANATLMHSLLKLASEPASDHSNVQQLTFALLSNLAVAQDCRCLIQKSNFLQNFLSLSLPKGGSKSLGVLGNLWLKLLWNVSLGNDGQQMIMKLKGSLDLLLEITKYKNKSNLPIALLILHNICFNPANKPKILANDKAVGLLSACLESESPNAQRIGASALWALLFNYQKAKVTLKNPLTKGKIQEALSLLRKNTIFQDEAIELYHLKCLENLEQILSN